MLHIKRLELVTDAPLSSPRAQALADGISRALDDAWCAGGRQQRLVIDRLAVEAPSAEAARAGFAREIAQSTVARILQRRTQE